MKHLYKSRHNRIFSGVIGGLGEYFELDPILLRLIWLLIVIFTGLFPGLVVYIIASFVVPYKPRSSNAGPIRRAPNKA